MTNVVNWLEKGTNNLSTPVANAIGVAILLLILVILPKQLVYAEFNKTTHIES